jgi:hypothetical protein
MAVARLDIVPSSGRLGPAWPSRLSWALLLAVAASSRRIGADVYVTNLDRASVTVFGPSAAGNVAPLRVITGSNTGFVSPDSATVDTVNGELYVADFYGQGVSVFKLGASGNVAPLRTISGSNSGIQNPEMVAVDTVNNEIFVLTIGGSILVFPRTASGNAYPTRVISGPATSLTIPASIAVDAANDELVTTSSFPPSILIFARTANGNVSPLRTITGAATLIGTQQPKATLDIVNNEILARVNPRWPSTVSSILVFPRMANGNVPPLRLISGSATGLYYLGPLRVDVANDRIVTTNEIANVEDPPKVLVFARTGSGNVKPLVTIFGPATGLAAPTGIDIDAAGGPTSTITDTTTPTANPQNAVTAVSTPVMLTLTATDPDDSLFSFTIVEEPSHGSISTFNSLTGSVAYTPFGSFSGVDSFTFVASDVVNTSAPAAVTIAVGAAGTAVPALDVRGLVILGLLLAGIGLFFLRRR